MLLNRLDVIYHAQGQYAYADNIVFAALEKLRHGFRKNLRAPATLTDWRPWLHEMRLFKSAEEIAVLRRAGEISALAHTRAMEKCRPGMFEYQLEGEILHEFTRHGARYPAYNTIVGGGENGCILHYTENECELRDGDLVLIDAGCEYRGYAGDITRTFPVNGKFTLLSGRFMTSFWRLSINRWRCSAPVPASVRSRKRWCGSWSSVWWSWVF